MVERLQVRYGEDRIAYGIAQQGRVLIEIYSDPLDGSFTVLRVLTNGQACIIEDGVGFKADSNFDKPRA